MVELQTYIPTDRSRKTTPNPRKIEANKLMSNSLKMVDSFCEFLGRDTSKTKNQAVKNVPMANRTVARCGNTAGLMGETYRIMESILLRGETILHELVSYLKRNLLYFVLLYKIISKSSEIYVAGRNKFDKRMIFGCGMRHCSVTFHNRGVRACYLS